MSAFKRLWPLGAVFLTLSLLAVPTFATTSVEKRPEVQALIKDLVRDHQYPEKELNKLFSQVTLLPKVIERISKPAEGLPWHRYRNIFIKKKRIQQGVEFWRQNEALLKRAEKEYGVPPAIIVAILGVETRYGRHKGGYRIIDSLTTLAVDYPRRSKFFSRELKEFLLLAREEGFNPLMLKGSYAGAMGKPQFISSSYRRYAVDFDGDGVRDLLNNTADAIGSVANYFRRHGWQAGQPITAPARVSGSKYRALVDKGIKPRLALAEVKNMGVSWKADFDHAHKGALIELEQKNGPEYWLGLKNFYVITRYNHSALYAMAVYQLSEAIREGRAKMRSASL